MRLINFAGSVDRMDEFHRLHPKLQAVFFDAANTLFVDYRKAFLITSMRRLGDSGVHGTDPCRGLDVDVCDKVVYAGGVLPSEAAYIAKYINTYCTYDPKRPHMNVAIYGDLDPKGKHWNHIHFQVHDRTVAI